jgi:signal peptidase I
MGPDVHARPLTDDGVPAPVPRRAAWRDYLEATLAAVVFALFVRTFLLQAYVVPSGSMEENILVGDHLLVNKFLYAPRRLHFLAPLLPQRPLRRRDVFIFKFPGDPKRDFVKRAIGLSGEIVEIRDKAVFVNGAPLEEPEIRHLDPDLYAAGRRDQFGPMRVPEDQIFALGDNRDRSNDSRFWGTVPRSNVKGRALLVYWSAPQEPPGRNLPARIADFFVRARWSRFFRLVR